MLMDLISKYLYIYIKRESLSEILVDGQGVRVGHGYVVNRWRPNWPPGGALRV